MHIIKLFNIKEILIIIVVNILFPPISFTMDAKHTFDESSRRNWRESLNIYDNKGENLVFNTDDWFNGTLDYINEDNELNIRSKFERESPNQSNISLARFTVICHVEDEIIYIPFDLGKIFVSGSNALNRDDSIVKEQGLLEKTVFPISFIDGPRPKGSVLNKNLQSKIKEVTGQVVKDATHSEGSLLIYLFKHLNVYLGEKIETTKNPLIIGSILEISNLKDSCSEFCIPMLETFMINLQKTLTFHLPRIKIAPILENIVLLSGRKEYYSSRSGMVIHNDKIKLNFERPNNRVFSKKID